MPPIKSFGERIADALVEDGLLSTKQVEELLELQKKEGTRLLKLILEKSYVSELDMVVSMGRVLNVPPVNLSRIGIPQDVAELVPREMATNHKVLPVSRLDNKLFLAMADQLNVLALDDVNRSTKLEVMPMIASEKAILDKLNNLDGGRSTMEDIIQHAQRQAKEEAESEAACDHRQHPIVSIAAVDSFAVDTARVEHTVDNIVELAERPLHVAFAGEIRYFNLISRDQTVLGRKHDHHLLAKQRQIVQARIGCPVGSTVDRNFRRRRDELFFNRLGRAVNQLQLDVGTRTAKTGE